jgi:hypothetical protein
MWYLIAENPWFLAGAFGLIAVVLLIAMKVTQDGQYLIKALIAFGCAGAILIIEQLIVTENERVEWTVRELSAALLKSDNAKVMDLMDEHVLFSMRSNTLGDELDLSVLNEKLADLSFDWIHLSRLNTNAGQQTGRGSAEFQVNAGGSLRMNGISHNFTGNSAWSLGFRRLSNGRWKINRITNLALPQYVMLPLFKSLGRANRAPMRPPGIGIPTNIETPATIAPGQDQPRGRR